MKFQPFDWANHDYGPDFGDEYDIEDRVDKVIEVAGGRPVALTVNSMNAPAIQLYRNHGFREVGTVSDNGVELLRMERKPVPEVDADVEQRPAR